MDGSSNNEQLQPEGWVVTSLVCYSSPTAALCPLTRHWSALLLISHIWWIRALYKYPILLLFTRFIILFVYMFVIFHTQNLTTSSSSIFEEFGSKMYYIHFLIKFDFFFFSELAFMDAVPFGTKLVHFSQLWLKSIQYCSYLALKKVARYFFQILNL